ncbi:hypothetical protein SKAU_G00045790 [Synaphobranchus kaupii]|uniref:Uncharacterized protein n=1 Tax=Synaphobranchus kaupii TaxID=118154 RepID=A0A9Q1G222_SYNKA|nr:hypothetical protein SKAU_G00045790 [Synaphobranchus kaupii]
MNDDNLHVCGGGPTVQSVSHFPYGNPQCNRCLETSRARRGNGREVTGSAAYFAHAQRISPTWIELRRPKVDVPRSGAAPNGDDRKTSTDARPEALTSTQWRLNQRPPLTPFHSSVKSTLL